MYKKNYGWRIHASSYKRYPLIKLETFNPYTNMGDILIITLWTLDGCLKPTLKILGMIPKDLFQGSRGMLRYRFRTQAYRKKKKALLAIHRSYKKQYKKIWEYYNVIKRLTLIVPCSSIHYPGKGSNPCSKGYMSIFILTRGAFLIDANPLLA